MNPGLLNQQPQPTAPAAPATAPTPGGATAPASAPVPAGTGAPAPQLARDPLIRQLQQQLADKVAPGMRPTFQKIIYAGMKVMFDPQTHQMAMSAINKPGDVLENVAGAIAGLMQILYTHSQGTMPPALMVPASLYLMGEALDFLEKTGKVQINQQTLAECVQGVLGYMMHKLNVKPGDIQQIAAQRDPQAAQQMAQHVQTNRPPKAGPAPEQITAMAHAQAQQPPQSPGQPPQPGLLAGAGA